MKDKKKIILSILGILLLLLVTVGVTFAVFTYTKLGTTENTVTTGTLKFLYTENTGVGRGINIENALPVSDEIGKSYTTENYVFDFRVEGTNTSNEDIPYEVTLRKKDTSTLSESNVKVYLTDMTDDVDTHIMGPAIYSNLNQTSIDVEDNIEKTLYNGTVDAGDTDYLKEFRLRMWISNTSKQEDVNGKTFTAMVNVYSNATLVEQPLTYTESILNGTDPVLGNSMIPIKIDETGTVTKADINNEWYKYEEKRWANAVILKDESIAYSNNEVIPESNIESYFVWIPRYKYKIFDEGNYTSVTSITDKTQIIEVEFENKNTTPSNGTTKDLWLTHPAFTSFDSNGFWVGKFDTGYDGATTTAEAQVNSIATDKIIIKPNVYSWRNMTVGNMFKNSYDYERELDSHMMKNTEWGAVTYLQHSKYGSAVSVRINNNHAYITGYSSITEPTLGNNGGINIEGNIVESTSLGVDGTYTLNYLNPRSTLSSTTGNYTGIYDMVGGALECVMGYTITSDSDRQLSEIENNYSNFFNDTTYAKYWDKYLSVSYMDYNKRILGDATGEMGPYATKSDPNGNVRNISSWYNDYGYFVWSRNPWFARGGSVSGGNGSGMFSADVYTGGAGSIYGFRIVITPNN